MGDFRAFLLKLQSLLYFIQGRFLTETGKPCFQEKIEAWKWGAVCPKAYYYFMEERLGANFIFSTYQSVMSLPDIQFQGEDKLLIDDTLDTLAKIPNYSLCDIIKEQSPWIKAYQKDEVISHQSMIDYFASIQDKEVDLHP